MDRKHSRDTHECASRPKKIKFTVIFTGNIHTRETDTSFASTSAEKVFTAISQFVICVEEEKIKNSEQITLHEFDHELFHEDVQQAIKPIFEDLLSREAAYLAAGIFNEGFYAIIKIMTMIEIIGENAKIFCNARYQRDGLLRLRKKLE
ncbi:hypothetical protein ALC53_01505 [Atta colombica]|uniref:Uncharacterized protein n=1 Tax=Atta colombica TaxID=520822 RepID=A0A195BUL2_9HYME|nr:hypothetical protein ALC53_01505 [Atta colombica]